MMPGYSIRQISMSALILFPGIAFYILGYWGPTFLDQSHLLVEKFAIFVLYLETRGAKKIKLS